jgi:DNA-binding CsgD family transcriptional regulator
VLAAGLPSLFGERFVQKLCGLAQRKTNPEIAHALCISPHRARHHTEAVLSKLGISSRREVRARIHL